METLPFDVYEQILQDLKPMAVAEHHLLQQHLLEFPIYSYEHSQTFQVNKIALE